MSDWSGSGLSQVGLMNKDECIVVDENDKITGHSNKFWCHKFSADNPRGILHRAFSVFLFDLQGRLLLQQRARSKITFPNVWTNTCCSHPLHLATLNEIDDAESLQSANVFGVKRAAIRKLQHELGIASSQLPIENFKFLTRLHYWAADAVTYGDDCEWGEHEIDYILFIQSDVNITPNPEEVDAIRYVTRNELRDLLESSGSKKDKMLWSPWFKIIAQKFLLDSWWVDLNVTLKSDKYTDVVTIHRFDPPREHFGGKGHAGAWLDTYAPQSSSKEDEGKKKNQAAFNPALKQGAYGKVKIIKDSFLTQLTYPSEILGFLELAVTGGGMKNKVEISNEDVRFCDDMVGRVSRSFAAVIRQLPKGLCIDVIVFYLALRGLDTVEDDMESFKDDVSVKIKWLHVFYQTALVDESWSLKGVGKGDEALLLEKYYQVAKVFNSLPDQSKEVIADITRQMGEGMAEFVSKDLGEGTTTVLEYNRYCHFVAGLVGEGLTRLFFARGYEPECNRERLMALCDNMGIFLQKTNIIRDYLEDYVDGRAFWPQEIWKKHAKTGKLGEFAESSGKMSGLACLNELITDALTLVPDCLEYMSLLRHPDVFRFCAIPQVMAIGTLAKCFNNADVFAGVVKIRKGQAVRMLLDVSDETGLHYWFHECSQDIMFRIRPSDPSAHKTIKVANDIGDSTSTLSNQFARRGVMKIIEILVGPWLLLVTLFVLIFKCGVTSPDLFAREFSKPMRLDSLASTTRHLAGDGGCVLVCYLFIAAATITFVMIISPPISRWMARGSHTVDVSQKKMKND